MENETQGGELKSSLKSRHIVMMSLGGAIGSGLFAGSGAAIGAAGPTVILSYLVSGLILFIIMHGVGQIVLAQEEKSVGMAGLISPFVGKRLGSFTDWVYWFTWMAVIVAEAAAIAQFLQVWWPHVPAWVFYLAVAVLAMGINLVSVRVFAETEYWLSIAKIVVIIILIVLGVIALGMQVNHLGFAQGLSRMNDFGGFAPMGLKGFFNSLLIVIFSYGGSELAAITVSETENPKVAIPKAIRGVMFRVIGFFVVPTFLFLEFYSWKYLATTSESPFALVFNRFHLPGVASIINLVIIVALFSVINSAIYATSRSLHSRTQGGFFGKLSKKQVPLRAIVFCGSMLFVGVVLAMIYPKGLWPIVASSISFTLLVVWIMLLISVLIFYFKSEKKPNFLIAISLLSLLVLLWILYNLIVSSAVAPNATNAGWPVLVFLVVVVIVSLLAYRKKEN